MSIPPRRFRLHTTRGRRASRAPLWAIACILWSANWPFFARTARNRRGTGQSGAAHCSCVQRHGLTAQAPGALKAQQEGAPEPRRTPASTCPTLVQKLEADPIVIQHQRIVFGIAVPVCDDQLLRQFASLAILRLHKDLLRIHQVGIHVAFLRLG